MTQQTKCRTCKKLTDLINIETKTSKNGKTYIKANCSTCKNKLTRFIKSDSAPKTKRTKKTKKVDIEQTNPVEFK